MQESVLFYPVSSTRFETSCYCSEKDVFIFDIVYFLLILKEQIFININNKNRVE